MIPEKITEDMVIVVNPKTFQVGCVLLQAALGGDSRICRMVDSDHWQLELEGLKAYKFTPAQVEKLVTILNNTPVKRRLPRS